MWCVTYTDGSRTFYPTQQAAEAAAGKREHVTWFDSFDYEHHNPGASAARYAERVAAERAAGIDFVRNLGAGLRRRLGLEEA